MKWAYGITTVPQRLDELLPRTIKSLFEAGFDRPNLFVDGEKDPGAYYTRFPGLDVTTRYPAIKISGNWVLSMVELYIREPHADRYALFQDDFVTCKNLKEYLERAGYPDKGYLNLYTFPQNQMLCPKDKIGWYPSNQMGRGAVALIFTREALLTCLTHQHMVDRPQDLIRGWKTIDGGIVTAMTKAGWKEYVHNPSLVQHTGEVSTLRNRKHPQATSFRGEDFDALELLR